MFKTTLDIKYLLDTTLAPSNIKSVTLEMYGYGSNLKRWHVICKDGWQVSVYKNGPHRLSRSHPYSSIYFNESKISYIKLLKLLTLLKRHAKLTEKHAEVKSIKENINYMRSTK